MVDSEAGAWLRAGPPRQDDSEMAFYTTHD